MLGAYEVLSNGHTYTDAGEYTIRVAIYEDTNPNSTGCALTGAPVNGASPFPFPGADLIITGHGEIGDQPIALTAQPFVDLVEGTNNDTFLFTLVDQNTSEQLLLGGGTPSAEYTITIDWGDGTSSSGGTAIPDCGQSPGTLPGPTNTGPNNGVFFIVGTHVYKEEMTNAVVLTTAVDEGGSTSIATVNVQVEDAPLIETALTQPPVPPGTPGPTTILPPCTLNVPINGISPSSRTRMSRTRPRTTTWSRWTGYGLPPENVFFNNNPPSSNLQIVPIANPNPTHTFYVKGRHTYHLTGQVPQTFYPTITVRDQGGATLVINDQLITCNATTIVVTPALPSSVSKDSRRVRFDVHRYRPHDDDHELQRRCLLPGWHHGHRHGHSVARHRGRSEQVPGEEHLCGSG